MTPTFGRRHVGCTILASGRAHDLPRGRPQVGMRQTPQQPAESGLAMFYEILAGASQNTLCNVRHYNSARDNQFSFMASNGETKWVFVGDYVFFLLHFQLKRKRSRKEVAENCAPFCRKFMALSGLLYVLLVM